MVYYNTKTKKTLHRSPLPRNWQKLLRLDENKRELFRFLAQCIAALTCEKQIISTCGEDILVPCTQEEADTRVTLHVADAIQQGYNKVSEYFSTFFLST